MPAFSGAEVQILIILLALFITVKGLEHSGLLTTSAQAIERGDFAPLRLMAATFFLSMLITNDAALIVIVPLTLAMEIKHKDILIILEALAANAGSALTPLGNPQNLYIYWYYQIQPGHFIATMLPFAGTFLALLVIASLLLGTRKPSLPAQVRIPLSRATFLYLILLGVMLLAVLHVLPAWTSLVVILVGLLGDRRTWRIDYALLLSLLFFFGLADNMQLILAGNLDHPQHVFLFSALASQVISNVPAALLFSRFTPQWEALLWGVSVGGFGSLFGSVANLIAYRLYVSHPRTHNTARFTYLFLAMGYGAFFCGVGLYFLLKIR